MKNLLLTLTLCLGTVAVAMAGGGGCTPDTSLTQPGFTPTSFPCVERGIYYDTTIYLYNFDSIDLNDFVGIPLVAQVGFIRIDTIIDFPTGLNYACNPPNCEFAGGTFGCINIYGTTNDPVGDYLLFADVTVQATVPGFGTQTLPLTSNDLPAGILDLSLDVINPGEPCPLPVISFDDTYVACASKGAELSFTLDAGGTAGPYTYAWSPSAGLSSTTVANPIATPTATTTYVVTITDGNTYSFSDSVVVEFDTSAVPVADFTFEQNASVDTLFAFTNQSVTSGQVTYAWDFGNGNNSSNANPSHAFSSTGTSYDVTLIVSNNCGADTVTKTILLVGIADMNKDVVNISVYPNPNKGVFTIKAANMPGNTEVTAQVYDITGRLVHSANVTGTIQAGAQVDLASAGKGIYFARITSAVSQKVVKLIVE